MKKQFLFLVVLLCFAGITMHAQQRKVLFEEFTASSCPPCATMNGWLNPLLETNAEKIVVVKYQMYWPAPGDPYYTAEGGTRRTYYAVNSVPMPFADGVNLNYTATPTTVQNAINSGYAQPAQATITGNFKVTGNNIIINGSVTPLISGSGYKIYVIVNEKMTTENKTTNGEKKFHHVMMKMFPDGDGTSVTLTSGTAIPFSYTYDMSTTHVEEMDDLEVVVFVQNISTKAVLNAAYLEDTTPAPQNVTATQVAIDNKDVNVAWGHPTGITPDGYNVYRNSEKINASLISGTSYQDVAPEYGKSYEYAVGIVVGGTEGYRKKDSVLIDITMPLPVIITAKQVHGKEMFIEWEIPSTQYAIKYKVYRSEILQTPTPITETSITNIGLSFKEYCFEIEPVFNEITGARSASVCVDLLDIPKPNNFKAEQVSVLSKEVLLTWTASTTNTAGYNLYRDGELLNTELITDITYTDVVPEFDVQYVYKLFGVAETGVEAEKFAEAKITLSNTIIIPTPENVKAVQEGDKLIVAVTWDAVPDIDGYNVYRDGAKINPELVTETEYSDNVPEAGEYCYTVTAVLGEEGQHSAEACVTVITVGICNITNDALFSLYPNPVSGTLNINTKETITDCQIFNIQGQLIYSTKSDVKEIATDSWASGVYIIRITTEKGAAEKRFIKN